MPLKQKTREKLNKISRNTVALVLMVAICLTSVITVMAKTVAVTIVDNGETTSISLMDPTEENILETAVQYERIEPVDAGDEVTFDAEANQLTIRRALDVVVTADGESYTVQMHYGDTVEQAVAEAGVLCAESDVLSELVGHDVTKCVEL